MSKNDVATETATDAKRPNRQISTTVPAEFYDGFFDHTWTARKKIGQLFREALEEYAAYHSIAVDGTAPHAD